MIRIQELENMIRVMASEIEELRGDVESKSSRIWPKDEHVEVEESDNVIFAQLTAYSSGRYEWREIALDSTGSWVVVTNGATHAEFGKAYDMHQPGGVSDQLKTPTAILYAVKIYIEMEDDFSSTAPVFEVISSRDKAVVHRTVIGTMTEDGSRKDLRLTEANVKNNGVVASKQPVRGEEGSAEAGFLVTWGVRGGIWDGTNKDWECYVMDVELDPNLTPVSYSNEIYVSIVTSTECA